MKNLFLFIGIILLILGYVLKIFDFPWSSVISTLAFMIIAISVVLRYFVKPKKESTDILDRSNFDDDIEV